MTTTDTVTAFIDDDTCTWQHVDVSDIRPGDGVLWRGEIYVVTSLAAGPHGPEFSISPAYVALPPTTIIMSDGKRQMVCR